MITPEATNYSERKEQIFLEMDKFVQEHPGASPLSYLQNFRLVIPDETFPEGFGGGKRYYTELLNHWDVTLKSQLKESGRPKYSEKRLNQTDRKFFQTIDEVIKESGIDRDKIKQLQKKIRTEGDTERQNEFIMQLYGLTLPVYIQLRALGYQHYDLTS